MSWCSLCTFCLLHDVLQVSTRSENFGQQGMTLTFSNRALEGVSSISSVTLEIVLVCSQFPNYPHMELSSSTVEAADPDADPLLKSRTYKAYFFAPFGGCPYVPEKPRQPVLSGCQYVNGLGLYFDMSSLYSSDPSACRLYARESANLVLRRAVSSLNREGLRRMPQQHRRAHEFSEFAASFLMCHH